MNKHTIWYTRCQAPTASGIAFQRHSFGELFVGTEYEVCNIQELGHKHADAHFHHKLDSSFREGGGSPPIWAYANGGATRLLAITFMEEALHIYVRADDKANSMTDLAGRRIALPLWPKLIFNFFRFAAEKGFHSALRAHGMDERDVKIVDVIENDDPNNFINPKSSTQGWRAVRSYYHDQRAALLEGRVDAIFAKGGGTAILEREAEGKIRLLYDLRQAPRLEDRVNNSTPRLLTVSTPLLENHGEAVVRYVQTLVRVALWAQTHQERAVDAIAAEVGIFKDDIAHCFEANFAAKLMPAMDATLIAMTEVMKNFLFERGYITRNFSLEQWLEPGVLAEAYAREGVIDGTALAPYA
jgi:ABC-type nitrate/sulfonate/bicarbonate transport system substrate-binding protein